MSTRADGLSLDPYRGPPPVAPPTANLTVLGMSVPDRPDSSGRSLSELRATVGLAIPIVFVQVGLMAMGFVDSMMAGHVSTHVLDAVTLGNLYFFVVAVFSIGTLMALDPLVAQALGAGDEPAVAEARIQRGLVLALLLSAWTALLMMPAHWLLTRFHEPPEIIDDATAYLGISIPGLLPFFAFVVLRQSLQAMHRVAPIIWAIVVANGLNAALNWVFLYGHLGSPPLGAPGSAIASAVARGVLALGLLTAGWRHLRPTLVPLRPGLSEARPLITMLTLGIPIGAQQALEVGAFGVIGLMMGQIGMREIGAHQVAIQLASMTFMVPLGVGAAAAVRVGHAIGARDAARAKNAARAAYLCGVGFMCLTALAFLTLARPLAGLITSDPGVIAVAVLLIPIAGVFQVFDGAQAVGAGILRGIGDTRVPLVVMLGSYWLLGVPVSTYLAFRTAPPNPAGLWWGFVVSLGAVAVFLFARVRVLLRRELVRIEG